MHPLTIGALVIAQLVLCLFVADFVTGIVHWAEDTWTAPGKSKLLDRWIVLDNIEHHRRPGTIRGGSYWTTNRVSVALAIVIALGLLAAHVYLWPVYFTLFIVSQGNQVHKWAHSSDRPYLVRLLQKAGLLQSRAHHGKHHARPYAGRFCAVTDYLNPILDATHFWRAAEWLIQRCGVKVQRLSTARGGY